MGLPAVGQFIGQGSFYRFLPVTWRDPGLDPNSERRDLWRGNTPTFRRLHVHNSEQSQSEKREKWTDSHTRTGRERVGREKREIKIYVDLGWVRGGGGSGYISKWMFGSLDGTRFSFFQQKMKTDGRGWKDKTAGSRGGRESCSGILAWGQRTGRFKKKNL